jgi:hypothetical protein
VPVTLVFVEHLLLAPLSATHCFPSVTIARPPNDSGRRFDAAALRVLPPQSAGISVLPQDCCSIVLLQSLGKGEAVKVYCMVVR